MDLGTVAARLAGGAYGDGAAFAPARAAHDLRTVFNNCLLFNRNMSTLWRMAEWLHVLLEKHLRDKLALTAEQAAELKALREAELAPIAPPRMR